MTFYKGTKRMRDAVLVAVLTTLAVFTVAVGHVQAQQKVPYDWSNVDWSVPFEVDNENELLSVHAHVATDQPADADGNSEQVTIILTDNILFDDLHTVEIPYGKNILINLSHFNFQGSGSLTIQGPATSPGSDQKAPQLHIVGSTTVFNNGLDIKSGMEVYYSGVYQAGRVDMLGATFGNHPDDTDMVYFVDPHSTWNALASKTDYIYAPLDSDRSDPLNPIFKGTFDSGANPVPDGTIVIGYEGGALLTIGAGNSVRNAETILGAKAGSRRITADDAHNYHIHGHGGILHLTDYSEDGQNYGGAIWQGLGTFYIGYEGEGTVFMDGGSFLQIGSIEIGREESSPLFDDAGVKVDDIAAHGFLDVSGKGIDGKQTMITIFGRDDRDNLGIFRGASEGFGMMYVYDEALIYFDSRETLDKVPSGFQPKITLGKDFDFEELNHDGKFLTKISQSTVENAYIVGAVAGVVRDPGTFTGAMVYDQYTGLTIPQSGAYMLERYNSSKVGSEEIYLWHSDRDIDGFTVEFLDSALADREVSVDFNTLTQKITVTLGNLATYDDVLAALNDTNAWEHSDGFQRARPVEDSFTLFDTKGRPINGSEIFPLGSITAGTMILGAPTAVKTGAIIGPLTDDSTLVFKDNSVLQGSLQIQMAKTTFTDGSIITPGFGSYSDLLAFGKIDFTGDFIHEADATTILDFNVHGNKKEYFESSDAWNNRVYYHGYLGDGGRDTITVNNGDAKLKGDVYFRPQSGYYADDIDIHFLQVENDRIDGQYDRMHLYPNRWFAPPTGSSTVTAPRWAEGNDVNDFLLDEGDGLHLKLQRNTSPFDNAANSFNTHSVAGALDEIYNKQTQKDWLPVLEWMWLMNDDELRIAMRQLAGETRASSFFMPVRSPWKLVFDRPSQNSVTPMQLNINCDFLKWLHHFKGDREQLGEEDMYRGTAKKLRQNSLWAMPTYDFLHAKDDGNASESTNSRIGFVAGYDRIISNRSLLGFLFSYSHPELKQGYAKVKADDFLCGVYFDTSIQRRYELKLWGSYGTQAYYMRRNIPIQNGDLASDYTGNTVALSSQIAMPVQWNNLILRPLAALDLNYVQQNSTTEKTGNEAVKLTFHDSDWTQLFGRVGMKSEYTYDRWDFNTSLTYSYLMAGRSAPMVRNRFVIEGDQFRIKGNDLGYHFVNFGLGGQRWLDDRKSKMLFVQYYGEYGKNSNTQTAMIGGQFSF